MALAAENESFVQVNKYHAGSTAGTAAAALFLQGFLPKYIPHAEVLELPLLVTVYFGLSRRSPGPGLLLGMVIGLLQDAVSHLPLGIYGMAQTVVGYGASWIGFRLDVEHPLSRFGLTFLFYDLERGILALIRRYLLAQPGPYINRYWLAGSVATAALAVLIYPQMDRLRKS
ncbi:MAG TPA: rod shape-determining protein MreD [Candidatus Acidoferrales bacterium]|nr:rod shape-determining protein MreD [Candidatus Acidoferrales bacterium]